MQEAINERANERMSCPCNYCGEAGLHVDEALFLSKPMHSHSPVWIDDRISRFIYIGNGRKQQTRKPVMCPSCTKAILDLRHECRKIKCQQA